MLWVGYMIILLQKDSYAVGLFDRFRKLAVKETVRYDEHIKFTLVMVAG